MSEPDPQLASPLHVITRRYHTITPAVVHLEGETYTVTDPVLGETLFGNAMVYPTAWSSQLPAATGATAGIPGTWTPAGSRPPATFAAITGLVASPATTWTTGQYVVLGDASLAHWNGTA